MSRAGSGLERDRARRSWLGVGSLLLPLVLLPGCGGLIEGVQSDGSTGVANSVDPPSQGGGESGPTDCPPTQWDCSGTPVSCEYVENESGVPLPVVELGAACRCDFSRPAVPTDCPENQLFVCGSLGWGPEPTTEDGLSFEPVSCRCAVNAGYYCSHCAGTGLYGSVEAAAGCGLEDGNLTGGRRGLFCGCGAQASR